MREISIMCSMCSFLQSLLSFALNRVLKALFACRFPCNTQVRDMLFQRGQEREFDLFYSCSEELLFYPWTITMANDFQVQVRRSADRDTTSASCKCDFSFFSIWTMEIRLIAAEMVYNSNWTLCKVLSTQPFCFSWQCARFHVTDLENNIDNYYRILQ